MTTRIVRSGQIKAPAAGGMHAFTPEGERAWVGSHWDPEYPAADSTLEPGLVFLAAGAVWVATDVEDDRVRYARVTPGSRAGLVQVRRVDDGSVEVTYDLTALNADADAEVRAFGDEFDAMLDEWERSVAGVAA